MKNDLDFDSMGAIENEHRLETPMAKSDKKQLGNTRVTGKEQYYTPATTADEIMENVKSLLGKVDLLPLLEPAGGTGNFIESAQRVGFKTIVSYDIEPHHPLVQQGSFLEQNLEISGAVTVSNPPFGRNNSLSVPFFNHAAKYSELIVFIVPRSWRKWTVQNKLDRRFHLVRDDDLTINYEDARGSLLSKKNLLRTCVQYWQKSPSDLRQIYAVEDKGIIERTSYADADASFTLFGYGCGTVKVEFERKPNTTQMFIKLNHPRALEAIESVDFSRFFLNTAYTEALSMHEINYLLNEYIYGDPMLKSEHELSLMD
jgi:predicted RNA methylase